MDRKRAARTLVIAAVIAASAAPAAGTGRGPHVAVGTVTLSDEGGELTITAATGYPTSIGYPPTVSAAGSGMARITGIPGVPDLMIQLSCVQADWQTTPYPLPPWIPYHVIGASGLGSDGATHHITIFDLGSDAFALHRDLVSVSRTAGSGPCGRADDADQVLSGDVVIGP